MPIPAAIKDFLSTPYVLTTEQINWYQQNKFIKLKNVLNEETLAYYNEVITEVVHRMNREKLPLEQRSTYGKAFLQLFNLWREDKRIRELIFSTRLAKIAADLMQTEGVRLYHDQALYKEAGGGITPWHADQYYWPLDSDKTITAWMPLQSTPLSMGPLEFSAGSNVLVEGRELQISDESERLIQERLRVTSFPHVIEEFDAGEISFHSGWVFHRAGANTSNDIRKVMTIIYMDKNIRLKQPENENQVNDWQTWCPGVEVGTIVNSP
ncbi:MAG: phytanoyl-CoA dioxygenase family protein, partial [Flavisolibacter sp.]